MNHTKHINDIFCKLFLTFFVTFLFFHVSLAADGDLDLTFNGTGKVITEVGEATDYSIASAIQTDGKIVVVGTSGNDYQYEGFAVARYNQNGSLDKTFDHDGRVFTSLGTFGAKANAVAIQIDGKIVVAGFSYKSGSLFTVIRYNSDGSLDTSFGKGGMVLTFAGFNSQIESIWIQEDGKIVAAGNSTDSSSYSHVAIVRYNADGSLDSSFDQDGILTTEVVGTIPDRAYSIAFQSDNKIVVYGFSEIIRFNADGSLDTSFGINGRVMVGQYRIYGTRTVLVQSDGKILAVGYGETGSAVFRFNVDGSPDNSFGVGGKCTLIQIGLSESNAVGIQSDGKIIIALGFPGSSVVVRVNPNGSLDSSFSKDGKVTTTSNWVDGITLIIQPDNKIITTKSFYRMVFPDRNFDVNRYNTDGSLDTSFNQNGKVSTGEFAGNSDLRAIAVQSDGKIVAVGISTFSTSPGEKFDFAVVRYNTNGSLDSSFGLGGRVSTTFGDFHYSKAYAVAIQTDGKIVVAGYGWYGIFGTGSGFGIVRYNQDGSLDTSFDGDGKTITEPAIGVSGIANSLVIQPDGKIVAAGTSTVGPAIIRYNSDGSLDKTFGNKGVLFASTDIVSLDIQSDSKLVTLGKITGVTEGSVGFAVSRYNPDGTGDLTFGNNGTVTAFFENPGYAASVKIQSDGKIVAVGNSTYYQKMVKSDFALVRFNSDGSLDNSFSDDGKVITQFAANSISDAKSVTIQRNGKILVAGNSYNHNTSSNPITSYNPIAVARYNSDGSLDTTFDGDGKLTTGFERKILYTHSMLLQSNGKIVVGGKFGNTFGLVRYQGTATDTNIGISGRITTANGRGIKNVTLQISGGNLNEPKFARTNSFGYYRFQDLEAGQTYVVNIVAKRYTFATPTRVITLNENLDGEDFVSEGK